MQGKRKNKRPTKLISILTRVLDWVRSEDYEDHGEYMVFGVLGPFLNERLREWDKASKVLNQYASRVRVGRRTSLNMDPELKSYLEKAELSDYGWEYVNLVLGGRPPREVKLSKSGHEDRAARTDIEQHFAHEFVTKLPKIVERAASLDEIGDEEIAKSLVPSRVKEYFAEAHRCYLYGFPVACAVLCRAILESALEEVIDPDGRIGQLLRDEAKKPGKEKQSYIGWLIEEAAKKHILIDDRPKCAIEVRDAGNDAIHNHGKFEKRLQDPLRDIAFIVNSTRKILIDLYSDRS